MKDFVESKNYGLLRFLCELRRELRDSVAPQHR